MFQIAGNVYSENVIYFNQKCAVNAIITRGLNRARQAIYRSNFSGIS